MPGLSRVAAGLLPAIILAQSQSALVFDVASIKPSSAKHGTFSGVTTDKMRVSARDVTLRRCIRAAYNVPQSLILGGPKWADEDRFDIDAKPASPAGDQELASMIQSLLAERFQLLVHYETRTLAGFVLVPEKGGIKMKRSDPDSPARTNSRRGMIDAEGCTLNQLALKLSETLQLPVADLTNTTGVFDFKLEWAPDDLKATPTSTGPSLFEAVQEQLGLKLESRKLPTQVLVIDRAQKPSAN